MDTQKNKKKRGNLGAAWIWWILSLIVFGAVVWVLLTRHGRDEQAIEMVASDAPAIDSLKLDAAQAIEIGDLQTLGIDLQGMKVTTDTATVATVPAFLQAIVNSATAVTNGTAEALELPRVVLNFNGGSDSVKTTDRKLITAVADLYRATNTATKIGIDSQASAKCTEAVRDALLDYGIPVSELDVVQQGAGPRKILLSLRN